MRFPIQVSPLPQYLPFPPRKKSARDKKWKYNESVQINPPLEIIWHFKFVRFLSLSPPHTYSKSVCRFQNEILGKFHSTTRFYGFVCMYYLKACEEFLCEKFRLNNKIGRKEREELKEKFMRLHRINMVFMNKWSIPRSLCSRDARTR